MLSGVVPSSMLLTRGVEEQMQSICRVAEQEMEE